MYNFNLTYDRHRGRYGFKTSDFPDSYDPHESALVYTNDPDWTVKLRLKRLNLKLYFFIGCIIYILFKRRIYYVNEFDKRKRREQRAM